jgi:hypothetical protein
MFPHRTSQRLCACAFGYFCLKVESNLRSHSGWDMHTQIHFSNPWTLRSVNDMINGRKTDTVSVWSVENTLKPVYMALACDREGRRLSCVVLQHTWDTQMDRRKTGTTSPFGVPCFAPGNYVTRPWNLICAALRDKCTVLLEHVNSIPRSNRHALGQ